MVKIDHMYFGYLARTSHFSALLTITNANCALLKMAAGSSFAEVDQEEIKGQKEDFVLATTSDLIERRLV